ncbi:MAG: hypothetical protein DI563_02110 [Variovorax paradoxus]|uniref:Uncharacterized protein n=1 Tax=Variovorax paradoxus TaxID=34073 RepID=A0A2W5QLY5_VARPD|nr:MAG: hypothetical protein DI563_02110 [Variovorax paradoxus]
MERTVNTLKASQIAAAFRAAKRYLRRKAEYTCDERTETYICLALDEAWMQNDVSLDAIQAAGEVIQDRLGCCSTMRAWLANVARVKESLLTYERVQRHRHAWLSRLIREFDAKAKRAGEQS